MTLRVTRLFAAGLSKLIGKPRVGDLSIGALALILFLLHPAAQAVSLPDAIAMKAALPGRLREIQVVEPHLSTDGHRTIVGYKGWPAEVVLDHLLGQAWRVPGVDVEFRARDGYVSRIPTEQFRRYSAYLVFERVGHPRFSVDNLEQNQKDVPLGPYYLVWDNVKHPELIAEGGTYWPYQVVQVLVSQDRMKALLPPGIAAGYEESAALAQKYCLSCHKLNGYGGDKWPGNLAKMVKVISEPVFASWIIQPSQIKASTTMPGLPEGLPMEERKDLAHRLYDYFKAVPVNP